MADFCVWKTLGAPFPRVLLCCPGPAINLIGNPFSIHWQPRKDWQTFLRQAWGIESTNRDSAYPLRSSFRTYPHIPHSKWLCSPNRAGLSEFHVHAPGSESPPFHLGPDTKWKSSQGGSDTLGYKVVALKILRLPGGWVGVKLPL